MCPSPTREGRRGSRRSYPAFFYTATFSMRIFPRARSEIRSFGFNIESVPGGGREMLVEAAAARVIPSGRGRWRRKQPSCVEWRRYDVVGCGRMGQANRKRAVVTKLTRSEPDSRSAFILRVGTADTSSKGFGAGPWPLGYIKMEDKELDGISVSDYPRALTFVFFG